MRTRKPLPELPRIFAPPNLDWRQREAARDYVDATCRGERNRPDASRVDRLWLRLGMRATLIRSRAGWVLSNPIYSDSLDRHPEHDPSLPGPGWLREVYRWRDRDLVTMPGVLSVIEARIAVLRAAEYAQQAAACRLPEKPAQADLFAEAAA